MNIHVNHNIALLIAEKTTSPVILTDVDQQIVWVNNAFTHLSGYALEEIKGQRPDFLHGEDTDKEVIDRIQQRLAAGQICNEQMKNYAKDGTTYWVTLDILPIVDEQGNITHFLAIEKDITDLKLHQKQIRESEQKLRAIYNSTKERNVLIGLDLRIKAFNKVVADDALKYFNRTIQEGDLITDFLFTDDRSNKLSETIKKVVNEKTEYANELAIDYPDGIQIWFSMTYSPAFDDDGQILGISLNLVDITEHKRAENKILEQNFQLREIARMQSHEVRRPLSNILGLSAIMENHTVSEDKKQYIMDKLKESAIELDEVVKKVVNASMGDN